GVIISSNFLEEPVRVELAASASMVATFSLRSVSFSPIILCGSFLPGLCAGARLRSRPTQQAQQTGAAPGTTQGLLAASSRQLLWMCAWQCLHTKPCLPKGFRTNSLQCVHHVGTWKRVATKSCARGGSAIGGSRQKIKRLLARRTCNARTRQRAARCDGA